MLFKHLLSIEDIADREKILSILEKIQASFFNIREETRKGTLPIPDNRHRKATCFSLEPSTRTLGSYYEAARLLGWSREMKIGAEASSMKKKESWADTARMLYSQGADVLVVRSTEEGLQKFLSEVFEKEGMDASVQNAGDGTHEHPSQTILDLVTISELFGRLDGLKIGFFGDLKYGRTVHSLLRALSVFKEISIYLASDESTALQTFYKDLFPKDRVFEGDNLEILKECDFVYGTRIQEERFQGDSVALKRAQSRFQINAKNLSMFGPDTYFGHPLPIPKNIPQYSPEIRLDKRMVFIQQADNGIPSRMFLLDEGYRNRHKRSIGPDNGGGDIKYLISEPLEEYMQRKRRDKKEHRYFKPIPRGSVIDHIAKGVGVKIEEMLWSKNILPKNATVHNIKNVPTGKNASGYKDVVILEDQFIPEEMIPMIAAISPESTFNIIGEKEGMFEKKKVGNPGAIKEFGKCPNTNCISNNDPEASTSFIHSGGDCRCHYCGGTFKLPEII